MKLNQQATLQTPKRPLAQVVPPKLLLVNLSGASHPTKARKSSRVSSFQIAENLLVSFKYAWAGLSYTFRTQRNFRLHLAIGALALSLGLCLDLNALEMAVIGLTSGVVLALELLNTAIEALVDLTVRQTYHDLAKIAKDCAAGAVLVAAIAAVVVASFLLLPPLWASVSASLTL